MYTKTIKHLTTVKETLEELLDEHSEKMLDAQSIDLQNDIEKDIIDPIKETLEQIDIIIDNIETGSYSLDNDDFDDDY
jgi:hypothetical protein